jgi:broad specificity phosphatase PhoE
MAISLVYETHSWSEDNEAGRATGWLHGRLSANGRVAAAELGERRRADGIAVVFTSDLQRAVETAAIAFADLEMPILKDWRLRECDYGDRNGLPTADVHSTRSSFLDAPYPNGESWRQAIERVAGFVDDLSPRWKEARVLVIGHVATLLGLRHAIEGRPVQELVDEEFIWQPGWEFTLHSASFR